MLRVVCAVNGATNTNVKPFSTSVSNSAASQRSAPPASVDLKPDLEALGVLLLVRVAHALRQARDAGADERRDADRDAAQVEPAAAEAFGIRPVERPVLVRPPAQRDLRLHGIELGLAHVALAAAREREHRQELVRRHDRELALVAVVTQRGGELERVAEVEVDLAERGVRRVVVAVEVVGERARVRVRVQRRGARETEDRDQRREEPLRPGRPWD